MMLKWLMISSVCCLSVCWIIFWQTWELMLEKPPRLNHNPLWFSWKVVLNVRFPRKVLILRVSYSDASRYSDITPQIMKYNEKYNKVICLGETVASLFVIVKIDQWSYLGYQNSNSASSSKFHHLALLVVLVLH